MASYYLLCMHVLIYWSLFYSLVCNDDVQCSFRERLETSTGMCVCVCVCACVFVGHCLATKVFIGKLPATGGVWVIIE